MSNVYFITDGVHTKVGKAKNMAARFTSLQVGNPKELTIKLVIELTDDDAALQLESYLHGKFADKAVRGEWFTLSETDIAEVYQEIQNSGDTTVVGTNTCKIHLRAQGERRIYMNKDSIFEKFFMSLTSGTENRVAIEILRGVNLNGFLRLSQEQIAKNAGTSISTVVRVFKKAKELEVVMPVGRRWYLNPYVALPYNLGDVECNKLQQMWDKLQYIVRTKGKITLNDALLVHEILFGPDKFHYNELYDESNNEEPAEEAE